MSGFELAFEVDLRRPPEDVFAAIADPALFRRIDPAMVDFGLSGPLGAGSTGWFVHRRGGMTARTTFSVIEFDRPTDSSSRSRAWAMA